MADPPPRDDIETTTPTRTCPICHTRFTRIRRQAYCSPRCRRTAWRRRQQTHPDLPPPPPPGSRRTHTVYACPDCESRYLGEQWCHDCNRPCTRVGPGGHCPHCDEPVAINELIDTQPDPA